LDLIELLRALIGVTNGGNSSNWQQIVRRLVDILIAGSAPTRPNRNK